MSENIESQSSGTILLKNMMSCAKDTYVEWAIDWPGKVFTIKSDFIAASLLEDWLIRQERDKGLVLYDDDNTKGMASARTDWTIKLVVGKLRFRVRLIKQIDIASYGHPWALELYPEKTKEGA